MCIHTHGYQIPSIGAWGQAEEPHTLSAPTKPQPVKRPEPLPANMHVHVYVHTRVSRCAETTSFLIIFLLQLASSACSVYLHEQETC